LFLKAFKLSSTFLWIKTMTNYKNDKIHFTKKENVKSIRSYRPNYDVFRDLA